ncbi:MAG: phosphoribosylformylglycinamidine synthase subunit PurS [Helicobacteraceae bacterium]|jgi:phosphoribosylformylglycinamidine synthase|nr:phosphoribosylformylglycinamidine synthase subunit PurS [Helicobacteraceae bacterium]
MKAIVNVFLKEGILDPQGKATLHALETLGFSNVGEVRIGKRIVLKIAAKTMQEAEEEAEKMAKEALVNAVIEDYSIEIEP